MISKSTLARHFSIFDPGDNELLQPLIRQIDRGVETDVKIIIADFYSNSHAQVGPQK